MNRTRPEVGASALALAASLSLVVGCASTRKDFTAESEAPQAERRAHTEEVFERGSAALVRIETPHRIGGGFVVGADGVIVTGYSLLQHEVTARAILADGTMFPVERVIAVQPDRDLALVAIPAKDLPVLDLAQQAPRSGEHVYVVGHAIGMAGSSIAEGVVGSTPTADSSGTFQIASPLPAGFFGAPVLDDSGHALGIIGLQEPDGATALSSTAITAMVQGAQPGGGETMAAFGQRTRDADGWQKTKPIDPEALADCSLASRERIWGELESAIETAAPVFELGGTAASFRVMEGSVLHLSRELPDCKALLDGLVTTASEARSTGDAMKGATQMAEALHGVLELLFEKSHALGPIARAEPGRRPRA